MAYKKEEQEIENQEPEKKQDSPNGPTLFYTRFKSYKIILKSSNTRFNQDGTKSYSGGLTVQFSNGKYETDDPKIVKLLKDTKYFGIDYFCQDNLEIPDAAQVIKNMINKGTPQVVTGTRGTKSTEGKAK